MGSKKNYQQGLFGDITSSQSFLSISMDLIDVGSQCQVRDSLLQSEEPQSPQIRKILEVQDPEDDKLEEQEVKRETKKIVDKLKMTIKAMYKDLKMGKPASLNKYDYGEK